jgi:hypothetical protein
VILIGDVERGLPHLADRQESRVFNLRTAKALGLTIPPSLLLRAEEVIQ